MNSSVYLGWKRFVPLISRIFSTDQCRRRLSPFKRVYDLQARTCNNLPDQTFNLPFPLACSCFVISTCNLLVCVESLFGVIALLMRNRLIRAMICLMRRKQDGRLAIVASNDRNVIRPITPTIFYRHKLAIHVNR